jgi:hypothetical protein
MLYNYPIHYHPETSYYDGDPYYITTEEYQDYLNFLAVRSDLFRYERPIRVNYFTLLKNNIFGNKARFTDINGNPILEFPLMPESSYFIDHFTGLGWIRDEDNGNTNPTFTGAIDYAIDINSIGFNDFHLASYLEFKSLVSFFQNADGNFWKSQIFGFDTQEVCFLWTSTTDPGNTARGVILSNRTNRTQIYTSSETAKSNNNKYFGACRIHFKPMDYV